MSEKNNQPTPAEVLEAAARRGLALTSEGARLLARYLGLLESWNRRMNLVGKSRWPEVLADLAADSFHLAELLSEPGSSLSLPESPLCLDIGAGAGIPGIPLRIFWRPGEYHMVEPREKRAIFLRVCLAELGLPRTHVERMRAEELPPELRKADLVLARALADWRGFLAMAKPLLAPGGLAVYFAKEPEPEGDPGESGFRTLLCRDYPGPGVARYFWVFTPAITSR